MASRPFIDCMGVGKMNVKLIKGECYDKSISLCYDYIRGQVLKEKQEKVKNDASNRDLREGQHRGAS